MDNVFAHLNTPLRVCALLFYCDSSGKMAYIKLYTDPEDHRRVLVVLEKEEEANLVEYDSCSKD